MRAMKMQDLPSSEAVGWLAALVYKFLPAALGAAIMIVIEPPKTRRELFWRLVAAFICSAMLGQVAFDFLHSLSWFAFLDASKRPHTAAVDFIVGGGGWFLLGGVGVILRKARTDPIGAVDDVKKVAP